MRINEALAILQPEGNKLQDLKTAYRKACFMHHPDHGGNLMMMQLVNAAMELLMKNGVSWTQEQTRAASQEVPLTETISKVWAKVKHFPGINGELIGSWLWVTGETKRYKEELKAAGFKFSGKKIAWYFHAEGYRKRSKHVFDLHEIRTMFNSRDLDSEQLASVA